MPKNRSFRTAQDCRRYLATVINRLEADEIDASKAGRLGYLVQILVRIIETSDLEARLKVIEERMNIK